MCNIEPFGYFRADACGWTDCHDDDEGATPLWDKAALMAVEKQRDDLLAAMRKIARMPCASLKARKMSKVAGDAVNGAKGGAACP